MAEADYRLPDGNIVTFRIPDDTPEDQAGAVMEKMLNETPELKAYWTKTPETADPGFNTDPNDAGGLPPSLMDQAMSYVDKGIGGAKKFGSAVADAYEGQKERDLPSFMDVKDIGTAAKARIAAAMAISVDDDSIGDVVKNTLPGSDTYKDKFGNTIVNYRNEEYYLNQPGMSKEDVAQGVSQAAQFSKFAAGKIGRGVLDTAKQLPVIGGKSGLLSGAQDLLMKGLGADPTLGEVEDRAITAAALGAGGEVVNRFARWMLGLGTPAALYYNKATGKLTPRGIKAAKRGGLNPDIMEDEAAKYFAQELKYHPAGYAAARVAGKEFNVDMTQGQAMSNSPVAREMLSREEWMRNSNGKAGVEMALGDARQAAQRDAAVKQMGARIGGSEGPITDLGGGEKVLSSLREMADKSKQAYQAAYKAAGERAGFISKEAIPMLNAEVKSSLSTIPFDPKSKLFKRSALALGEIKKLDDIPSGLSLQSGGKTWDAMALDRIENTRKVLGRLVNQAKLNKRKGGEDYDALVKIKGAFDDWQENVMNTTMYYGDDTALAALKSARGKFREHQYTFGMQQEKDAAGRMIMAFQDDAANPEMVANALFGKTALNGPETAVAIVKRMEQIFGAKSPELDAVRQMAWNRLTKDIATDSFSPQKFSTKFNTAMNQNEKMLKTLWGEKDLNTIKRFQADMLKTIAQREVTNTSKTAYTSINVVRDLVRRTGTMLTFRGQHYAGGALFTVGRVLPSAAEGITLGPAARGAWKPLEAIPRQVPGLRGAVPGVGRLYDEATQQGNE